MELEMPMLKEILEESGGNEQLLEEQLNKLRLWLKQQPHLPQGFADISDQRLKFLICTSRFNLEKVKRRLDLHYTLRNMIPELSNRDPKSDSINQCCKYFQIFPLSKLTSGNYRLFIVRLLNPDTFDFWTVVKYCFMTLEMLVEEDIVISNIFILDATNFRMDHALKFTPNLLKRADSFLATYARKIKAVHIINVPNFFDWLMSIAKAVINVKVFNRIHLHKSGIESLYEIIPKSILPIDYGGEVQYSTHTLADMWYAKLVARREWFLEQEKISAKESLRYNSVINPNDLFGVSGTFQKLDID